MTSPDDAGSLAARRPSVAGVLSTVLPVLLVVTGCWTGERHDAGPTTVPSQDYPAELVAHTDRVRDAAGGLSASTCAEDAAAHRAAALVGEPELVHAPLDDVIAGCRATTAGENLSRSSAHPADVVAAWMESPGHRANILDPAFTETGIACVQDGQAMLCSQVFLGYGDADDR